MPDLLIIGEGGERSHIEGMIQERNLQGRVHLVGQKSYQEMPLYYALAETFIHASTTEQWGLVVNEAMASGLPVMVSHHCGCAADLVQEGVNGFTFDPYDEEELAGRMHQISRDPEGRRAMGIKSQEIIASWSPSRFAQELTAAISMALASKKPRGGLLEKIMLRGLSLR
jgi:glycosyltransferase involved in cell wall biosynthesis